MGFEIIGENKPLTWKQFEKQVNEQINASPKDGPHDWMYRGQSDSTWTRTK